jgi:hypothetical protein
MVTRSRPNTRMRSLVIGICAAAWMGAVVFGQRVMLNYDYAPAAPGTPSSHWPTNSSLPRTEGLATIVVVAHPHCPCTRATIEELARLMAHVRNRATAVVVFVRPQGVSEDWTKTDLWASAARIPGVTPVIDTDDVEGTLFGAQASGQTMLYSATGELQFSGGITASRGHSGDNAGQSAIASLVNTGYASVDRTSVFGCSLRNPERARNQ